MQCLRVTPLLPEQSLIYVLSLGCSLGHYYRCDHICFCVLTLFWRFMFMATAGDRSGGVVQNYHSCNQVWLPLRNVKHSVLTERTCLSWMIPHVPPLFTLAQIVSSKQGPACARSLILRVCIKWQGMWLFPVVRMQLPWNVCAVSAAIGCERVPWGALLMVWMTLSLRLLCFPPTETMEAKKLLFLFTWAKPYIKNRVRAALECLQSTWQDFLSQASKGQWSLNLW